MRQMEFKMERQGLLEDTVRAMTEDGAALQSHLVYLTNAMRHLTWENQDFQR